MFARKTARCPVCTETFGSIVPGEVCSFVCHECKFIFTWDSKGVLLSPVKWEEKKPHKGCGCYTCQDREKKKSNPTERSNDL